MNERSSRSRPISLSSVEQLAPGQILPPLLPGAPSYPPSNLYENLVSRDQVRTRSRPTSIIGNGISGSIGYNGGVEQNGRVQEGNWSPSLERNTVKRHSIPILTTIPYASTSNYQETPLPTNTPYHPSHSPAQYMPYSTPTAAVITNQVPLPSSIQQQSILSPVELQYHQQLVTYYLGYARQGRLAPVTDERQERARLEAIAWARSEGVLLPDPVMSNQPPPVAQYVGANTQQYQVTSPSTPTRQQAFPLPSINTNTTPIPNSTSFSNIAYLNRSTSLATASATPILAPTTAGLIRSSSAAASPSTSASNTPYSSNPPSPTKRPLPIPPTRSSTLPNSRPLPQPSGGSRLPLDQLANLNLNDGGITLTREGVERRNSVPIPSFSFGATDESSTLSPAVVSPSLNIIPSPSGRSLPSILSIPTGSIPSFSTPTTSNSTASSAHIHPRLDPSHPSHYLYHPTSTNTTSSKQKTIAAGTIVCTRCKVQMFGRALMALGKEWHPECFSCSKEGCGVLLEHVQFDGKKDGEEGGGEGEVFCMVHYEELYVSKCYQCKTPIAAEEYVLVDSPLLLPPGPRTYHALHFFCSSCGDPFVDPKSLAKGKEGTLAAPFMVNKGFAYCQGCDLKMFRPKCVGCKKGIGGEWAEVEGKMWHVECFTCCGCEKPLTGDYLVKDDDEGSEGELPYCIPCYNIKARND